MVPAPRLRPCLCSQAAGCVDFLWVSPGLARTFQRGAMVRVGALGALSLEAGHSHGLSSCLSSGLFGLPFLSMDRT